MGGEVVSSSMLWLSRWSFLGGVNLVGPLKLGWYYSKGTLVSRISATETSVSYSTAIRPDSTVHDRQGLRYTFSAISLLVSKHKPYSVHGQAFLVGLYLPEIVWRKLS